MRRHSSGAESQSGKRRRRLAPRAVSVSSGARTCALIALISGASWSLVTPSFQGRDEPDHFAYVQQLAESWTLPGPMRGIYSSAEQAMLLILRQSEVRFSPQQQAPSTTGEQRALQRVTDRRLSEVGHGDAGLAASEPPLYYAIETLPYAIAPNDPLVQLELMRIVSALMGAVTMIFIALFVRELLPAVPWAATAGGLCVAMFPLLGFMSGTVNPDVMLYGVASATFLFLARAFRCGLTSRRAVAIGLLLAFGLLTKLDFLGLVPGILTGIVLLTVRQIRVKGWRELRLLLIAIGVGGAPVAAYALVTALTGALGLGIVSGTLPLTFKTTFKELSYIWELYLPRLPGMTGYFHGLTTYRDIWFDRMVGDYGWEDTVFPGWVDDPALIPAAALAVLCAREFFGRWTAVRARISELATYVAMAVGNLMIVGTASYLSDAVGHSEAYADPRYLLPMLALFAASLTLAIRGAGRKWGPIVAVVMVVLFFAHDLFSQLQVIARYYG